MLGAAQGNPVRFGPEPPPTVPAVPAQAVWLSPPLKPRPAPAPRLPSQPAASCSCMCSTSGLLAKTQVGCSTVPCLAWVWKICRGQGQALRQALRLLHPLGQVSSSRPSPCKLPYQGPSLSGVSVWGQVCLPQGTMRTKSQLIQSSLYPPKRGRSSGNTCWITNMGTGVERDST